jgi:triacylglycerol lipase
VRTFALAGLLAMGCGSSPTGLADPDAASMFPADGDAAPAEGPYPIVLAHGLFGFSSIGPLDYFYGIPAALEARGRTVFTPRVDAVQSAEVRGAQLVQAIEAARMQTGAAKVVVIGHSQGGLDARWAAAHDPDAIAAVITVATPHRGSPVADIALGLAPGVAADALDALGNLFGLQTDGSTTSFQGALDSLSTAGAAAFNAATPDMKGIPYFSIAGRSDMASSDDCPSAAVGFMATWDSSNDPLGAELVPVAALLEAGASPAHPIHDGLVTTDSAQWGDFLGCIPADHLDEVCQIAGASPGAGNAFDCLAFWTDLESFLAARHL